MATKKGTKTKSGSIHELTSEELDKLYFDLLKEKQEIRFNLITSSVSNVRRIRYIKKEVARVLTVQNMRKKIKA